MSFPNASKGLKTVFTGEILEFIAVLAGGIFSIAGVFNTMVLLIGLLAAAVLGIVGYILQIKGLVNAGKDNSSFVNAWQITVGILAAQVILIILNMVFQLGTGNMSNFFIGIFQTIAYCMVFNGMCELFEKQNDEASMIKLVKAKRIFIIVMVLALIFELCSAFVQPFAVVYAIVGLAFLVFAIIAYVLYLKSLLRASKAFKE